jgi:hypothetical protein
MRSRGREIARSRAESLAPGVSCHPSKMSARGPTRKVTGPRRHGSYPRVSCRQRRSSATVEDDPDVDDRHARALLQTCGRRSTCRPLSRALKRSALVCSEVSQIRRWLVLLGRHEKTVPAQKIDFIANCDMHVVFSAHALAPPQRLPGRPTAVILDDRPRMGQRMVDRGDFVVQHVRIDLVEIDALPEPARTIV